MLCYHGIKLVKNMKQDIGLVAFIFGLIEQGLILVQFGLRLYALIYILMKNKTDDNSSKDVGS